MVGENNLFLSEMWHHRKKTKNKKGELKVPSCSLDSGKGKGINYPDKLKKQCMTVLLIV